MRIALVAPVWFPVPPRQYGGIERVVALLADGLLAHGHDVKLFASGDSSTRAPVEWLYERAPSEDIGQLVPELHHALFALGRWRTFDVVHDHTGPLGAALGGLIGAPFVHTVHGTVDGRGGELYERACILARRTRLIAISHSQRSANPRLPWLATCHNGIDVDAWPFSARNRKADRRDWLLFLGRMGHDKGAHRAIEVARAAGLPLKIAAKCIEPGERAYFEEHVRPFLGDGVEYLGEVGERDKLELLRHARALLHPIAWEEPFGLVMVEAMACGTPVVAVGRGSVPEVVEHGRSGVVVADHRAMPDAIFRADRLDPTEIRRSVEERFSARRLVEGYLAAYAALLAERVEDETAATEPGEQAERDEDERGDEAKATDAAGGGASPQAPGGGGLSSA